MPWPRRPFLIALALSGVAHLAWVFAPGWQLGDEPAPAISTIDANIVASRFGGVRRVHTLAPPRAKPAAPEQPAEPAAEPQAENDKPADTAAAAAKASGPADVEPVSQAVETRFPRSARLGFVVMRGDQGLQIGHATHTWRVEGDAYRLTTVTTSTGIVALFKNLKLGQTSEGGIGPEGLKPTLFRGERDGVVTEEVRFDWAGGKVFLKSGNTTREADLAHGAQDILSLFYQTALISRWDETIAVNVATGKSFNAYRLARVGDERIQTRLGVLRALHLRRVTNAGEDGVDIWLAHDLQGLPARIRFTDRKGDVYDQVIDDIEIDGARPNLPPSGSGAASPGLEPEQG